MLVPQISLVLDALGFSLSQESNLAEARKILRVEIGLSREPQNVTISIRI